MSHFRPISLCNITYKPASKAIANRLKPFLTLVVSETQSAFLLGRLITDNVLVAYEINHYLAYKYWGSTGHAALKLDLSKAYDRMEWSFLERVLIRLGFHSSFVSLICTCVNTVSYSVLLSGQKFGYFHAQRGLRQGDPLSPYLFLFCAEVLSNLVSKMEAAGELKGVAVSRGGPRISHLLFANVTLNCFQASAEAMRCIRCILGVLEATSGLKVNFEKSSIIFSKHTPIADREGLARILGVRMEAKHDKYLGMPAVVGRSKRDLFFNVKDRVWARLQRWKCKSLSQAGKLILIKSVIQTMPTYVMSCLLVPNSICQEIEGMMADFFLAQQRFPKSSLDRLG
ncbi:UNVERIFIED_CONTAM: putative mitochondrial protein [Sesamum radiatum]|uniref:Mitochondrial protein n=1 Tax=Sesamum radiatum TaxID=300843 RepID=A0AAW2TJB3_SESRA